jgi:recombination protein RecT
MANDDGNKPDSLQQSVGTRGNLKELLERNKEAIAAVIPTYLTPDKMLKVVMLTAMNNPDIFNCTKESILKAVMVSAQTGIPIGPQSGHLVPFNRHVKAKGNVPEHWLKEAQFIPDYRGLIAQAKRCDAIIKAEAHLVCPDDVFEIDWGNEAKPLTHKPAFASKKRESKDVIAAYFRAKLPGGDYQYEVMTKDELDKIRARSKAKDSGPWVTDTAQMYRKTVTKRGLNYIPNLDDNLIAAIQHDNALESGEDLDVVGLLQDVGSNGAPEQTMTTHPTTEKAKTKMESVAGKVAGARQQQETKTAAKTTTQTTTRQSRPTAVSTGSSSAGSAPPWAVVEAEAQQQAIEPEIVEPERTLEDQVQEMVAEREATTEGLDMEYEEVEVKPIPPKNPEVHKVKFPEYINIITDNDQPSDEHIEAMRETFAELCKIVGPKSLEKTISDFTGLTIEEINAETVIGLTKVFQALIAKSKR